MTGNRLKAKTCGTCHQPNIDTAGPSLQKIAQIYKEQNANLVAFLKGEAPSIVDPSKADMMKPLLAHVKSLSEEEIKALADYILR
ncbi:MAG TPA: c-type cytochrome [Thermodesulfovibrionia bacterium]|nr:c-type cytochrome [Thermodesulfovibrionia bacterium]